MDISALWNISLAEEWMLMLLMRRRTRLFIGLGLNGHIEVVKKIDSGRSKCKHVKQRTPIDEAVSRGKMDVIDAINATAAQVELGGVTVS
ncbi:hypothetical protein Patl1_29388 [Pistacia atlantica]|uniref:Uncharacterized protein n=1 Tax=Pistacia atlantica TaxID=434234 RepID=A0ACC1ADH1_9ROSI|nr:hypothetical protein Patl1_29388 [Pistacia atlantica]